VRTPLFLGPVSSSRGLECQSGVPAPGFRRKNCLKSISIGAPASHYQCRCVSAGGARRAVPPFAVGTGGMLAPAMWRVDDYDEPAEIGRAEQSAINATSPPSGSILRCRV